ncbi:protein of unknown function DUF296 [Macleaya cordata]|uniref:AT-hook motif nuclear-localized protein n=1 Tax=Macleaya cordata TaxID=56857 RepID=A0A200R5A7_MACCD|nr:protein of unknown function DUF296 [Macleaya cordata]
MEGRESTVSGSPTNTETESPVSCGVVPQVMDMAVNMSMERTIGGGGGGAGGETLARKKRGRPRKYSSDGNISFSLSSSPRYFSSSSDYSGKRGRGRPPGSGNRHVLTSLGEWVANSAGGNFTPHVVTINTGEDVAAKIFSFAHKGPRAICILSANGAVSNVTIRQPCSSGGLILNCMDGVIKFSSVFVLLATILRLSFLSLYAHVFLERICTMKGRFEILSLSGSFSFTDTGGGVRSRTGGLSVSLAGPDGRVIGGGVAGLLTAASPIQVVVGSFVPNSHKVQKKKHYLEPSRASTVPSSANVVTAARPISQATPDDDNVASPTSTLPEQNQGEAENSTSSNHNPNSTFFQNVGWQGSQSASDQKPSPDINVSMPGE